MAKAVNNDRIGRPGQNPAVYHNIQESTARVLVAASSWMLLLSVPENHKRGHSTFPVVLVGLAVEARIQGRALQPFLSASECHRMECREQGCVSGL